MSWQLELHSRRGWLRARASRSAPAAAAQALLLQSLGCTSPARPSACRTMPAADGNGGVESLTGTNGGQAERLATAPARPSAWRLQCKLGRGKPRYHAAG